MLGLMFTFPSADEIDSIADRLHAASGGNPLFLVELLRSLDERRRQPPLDRGDGAGYGGGGRPGWRRVGERVIPPDDSGRHEGQETDTPLTTTGCCPGSTVEIVVKGTVRSPAVIVLPESGAAAFSGS